MLGQGSPGGMWLRSLMPSAHRGIRSAATLPFADGRPGAAAQRRLAEAIIASPRVAAQRTLVSLMREHSTAAQRRRRKAGEQLPAVPVQRMGTLFTDALATANPAYLRELSTIHAPGLWDYTNNGAFAVSHKGRKYALGMSDADYSAAILARTTRTKWIGSYHFSQEIDLRSNTLKQSLHGRDCESAANYLLHHEHGHDPATHRFAHVEKASTLNADFNRVTARPNVLPHQVPAGVKDANAQADVGEAYCIVSEPLSGQYNFHYGCVAAKKGGETLTVEGFATGSVTTPDWSFNVYDSASTFHDVWRPNMTKVALPRAPGYPFTFVVRLG
jgi:hypothetical protein